VIRRRRRLGHPPRRAIPTRAGVFTLIAPMILGVAGVTAGNNLLFLLLGASLGTIVLSGILSEDAVRGIRIRLRPLQPPEVGARTRISVEWTRGDAKTPAYALALDERVRGVLHRESFRRAPEALLRSDLPVLRGARAESRATRVFTRRGRAELHRCEISTIYPFGLLRKVRDVEVEAEIWVRPARIELPAELRASATAARDGRSAPKRGLGVEPYGLREWTDRDPLHRIHALRSARHATDVMVETTEEEQPVTWMVVWNEATSDPEALDRVCEIAAAYARHRAERGARIGLASIGAQPVSGELDRVLDRLARLEPEEGSVRVPPSAIGFCPAGATARSSGRTVWVDAQGRIG